MNKKGRKVSVDFTGVEAGSGVRLLPEGPMQFEVEEVTEEIGEDSKEPYLSVKFKVVEEGEYKGVPAWDNFSLQPQALWKLRGLLDQLGVETVDGEMDIDLNDLEGLVVIGDVIHEEFRGKVKHRISSYTAVDGDGGIEDKTKDVGEGKAAKKKAAKSDDATEPAFKVKQKVSFKDGKKTLTGTITEYDEEKSVYTVRVGKDEYEMEEQDLSAA